MHKASRQTSPSSRPAPLVDDGSARRAPVARGGAVARLAVVLTVCMVLAMVALIFQRWARVPEPTSAIMVYGDKSLDGAQILVESADAATQPGNAPVDVTLKEGNNFQTPVFRTPGRYHVTVTLPWRAQPVVNENVSLGHLQGAVINLPTVVTVIGDDSMNGAEAMLSSNSDVFSEKFTRERNWRIPFVVPPGQYSLSVFQWGITRAEDAVTVTPHASKEIDLRKKA